MVPALKKATVALLVFLPVANLAINAIQWVRHGVDLPYLDDWRPLLDQSALSLSPSALFRPSSEVSPLGAALDSLAQRLLDGNAVAYQLASLVLVLGGLLWLQWVLLSHVLKTRLLAACAFSATCFMLQPTAGWGLQNGAYHQALALLCILSVFAILWVLPWHRLASPVAVFTLGALSGLSALSGALAAATGGTVLVLLSLARASTSRDRLKAVGASLGFAGLLTLLPHLWAFVFQPRSLPEVPLALPTQSQFWAWAFGKVARSLLLPGSHPVLSLALTICALGAVVAVAAWLYPRGPAPLPEEESVNRPALASIFLGLAIILGVSLRLVAGHAHERPEGLNDFLPVFQVGWSRVQFLWFSLLWPWLVAAGLALLARRVSPARLATAATVVGVALSLFGIARGAFAHGKAYSAAAEGRSRGLQCIRERFADHGPLVCPTVSPSDLRKAVAYAASIGASFTRGLADNVTLRSSGLNPQPFAFGNDAPVSAQLDSPVEGTIVAARVYLGNFGGKSDGTIELQLCSAAQCSSGTINLVGTPDNEFLAAQLRPRLPVVADERLTLRITGKGSTRPAALWTFDSGGLEPSRRVARVGDGREIEVAIEFLPASRGPAPASLP